MKRYIKSDEFNDYFRELAKEAGSEYLEEWDELNAPVETFEEANRDFEIPTIELDQIRRSDYAWGTLIHKYGFDSFVTEYHMCCIAQSNHKFILFMAGTLGLFTVVSGYSSLNEIVNLLKQWYDFDNEMLGNSSFDYIADKAGYNVESSDIFNEIWR